MKLGLFNSLCALLIAFSVAFGAYPVRDVHAAPPTPASPLIQSFVLETDHIYGYEMFRPASWVSQDLTTRRVYVASSRNEDRLTLAVTNFKVVAETYATPDSLIPNYELFQQDPSLLAWTTKLEGLWANNGISYTLVDRLSNATIYAVSPDPQQIQLIAYVVSDGQPFGLALNAFGTLANPALLKRNGLLSDLETMAASIKAIGGVSAPIVPRSEVTPPLLPDSGPFHGDSGYRYDGAFTYRLQSDYYQAPPRIYWLYEYMYYSNYRNHDTWLYNTSVTDYPQTTCVYGNSYIYFRTIEKMASRTTGIATDAYTPNLIVAHLNTTTAHMMVFGDPMLVMCMWYFPYTQM